MTTPDRLLTRILRTTLPLVIWGAHFFFCYAYAAMACQRGADPASVLGAVSVLALGAAALLSGQSLRRVCRSSKDGEAPGLEHWAYCVTATLSLVAIIWTCVPMLMLDMCASPEASAAQHRWP
ncbi:MAG: hypothetical protein ABW202_15130 [Duganella sp.]